MDAKSCEKDKQRDSHERAQSWAALAVRKGWLSRSLHTRSVRLLWYAVVSASGVALKANVPAALKPKRAAHRITVVLLRCT